MPFDGEIAKFCRQIKSFPLQALSAVAGTPNVGGMGREAASSSPGSVVLQRGWQTFPADFVQFGSGSRSRAQRRRSKAVDRS
jgi:hypothetical protein